MRQQKDEVPSWITKGKKLLRANDPEKGILAVDLD